MSKDISQLTKDLKREARKIERVLDKKAAREIGLMAVDVYKGSFKKQKFNDSGASPWEQVKRRENSSGWYGFKLGQNQRRPGAKRKRRPGTKTNFSRPRTTNAILHGSGSSNLRDSIFLKTARPDKIEIANDAPYAEVQNNGGYIKVFGRSRARIPGRKFMGHNKLVNFKAGKIMNTLITKTLK